MRYFSTRLVMLPALACSLWLAAFFSAAVLADTPVQQIEVIAEYPHDPAAFTQGLVIHKGALYEGTGRNGESALRLLDLETGEVLKRENLSSRYFGEGITILGDKLYQLTWQSHLGFVYAVDTLKLEKNFFLPGEGWGITHDGKELIVSDGTAMLRFIDPQTLKETRRVAVTQDGLPVNRLNELEYINGQVWANVWYTDTIVRINPANGQIVARIDLTILNQGRGSDDVLNGIAWDAENERLFVTGKLWPKLYEIRVLE